MGYIEYIVKHNNRDYTIQHNNSGSVQGAYYYNVFCTNETTKSGGGLLDTSNTDFSREHSIEFFRSKVDELIPKHSIFAGITRFKFTGKCDASQSEVKLSIESGSTTLSSKSGLSGEAYHNVEYNISPTMDDAKNYQLNIPGENIKFRVVRKGYKRKAYIKNDGLYITYTPPRVSVSSRPNNDVGGTVLGDGNVNNEFVERGSFTYVATAIPKPGYKFTHWTCNNNGAITEIPNPNLSVVVSDSTLTANQNNIEYIACFEKKETKVDFEINADNDNSIIEGTLNAISPNVSKTYKFEDSIVLKADDIFVEDKHKAEFRYWTISDSSGNIIQKIFTPEAEIYVGAELLQYSNIRCTAYYSVYYALNLDYDSTNVDISIHRNIFDFKRWQKEGIGVVKGALSYSSESGFKLLSLDNELNDCHTSETYYIPVDPGKTYWFECDVTKDGASNPYGYEIYVFNHRGLDVPWNASNNEVHAFITNKFSFTVPNNKPYITFRVDANAYGNEFEFSNFRIYSESDEINLDDKYLPYSEYILNIKPHEDYKVISKNFSDDSLHRELKEDELYLLDMCQSYQDVTIESKKLHHSITLVIGENVKTKSTIISPASDKQEIDINYGCSREFIVDADSRFEITAEVVDEVIYDLVMVTGSSIEDATHQIPTDSTAKHTFVIDKVAEDCVVDTRGVRTRCRMVAKHSNGCKISTEVPSVFGYSDIVYAANQDIIYNIEVEDGYTFQKVVVDGVEITESENLTKGSPIQYKFFNINADHTIWAIAESPQTIKYPVTVNVYGAGKIIDSAGVDISNQILYIEETTNLTIKAVPDDEHHILQFKCNGVDVDGDAINENSLDQGLVIEAIFEKDEINKIRIGDKKPIDIYANDPYTNKLAKVKYIYIQGELGGNKINPTKIYDGEQTELPTPHLVEIFDYDGETILSGYYTEGQIVEFKPNEDKYRQNPVMEFKYWSSVAEIDKNESDTYSVTVGKTDIQIGAICSPASGATEYDIKLTDSGMTIYMNGLVGEDVRVDWGDSDTVESEQSNEEHPYSFSHTYVASGEYTIKVYGLLSTSLKPDMNAAAPGVVFCPFEFNETYKYGDYIRAERDYWYGYKYNEYKLCTFDSDEKMLYSDTGKELHVADYVTAIRFSDDVKSIGYKYYGNAAYINCPNLQYVSLGSDVTNIYVSSFANCISLRHITIPFKNNTNIFSKAFLNCQSLGRIVGISKLQTLSLAGCNGLTKLILPESVTNNISSNSYVFDGCNNIATFDFSRFKTVPYNKSNTEHINGVFNGIDEDKCNILVPVKLYEEWYNNSSWSSLKNCLVPVGDLLNIDFETGHLQLLSSDPVKFKLKYRTGNLVNKNTMYEKFGLNYNTGEIRTEAGLWLYIRILAG